MDPTARQVMINKAIEVIQREVLILPIHRQVVPWATRANISLVHRADNKFAPLWIKVQ